MQIKPELKDFQVAQALFGLEYFRQVSKLLCPLVKRMRKKPLLIHAVLGDTTLIDVQSDDPRISGLWAVETSLLA